MNAEEKDEHTYETENESARGSVRWGSQCTTEAVGCHKDPKSWFFHIHTKMIVLIKRTNTTRRNDLRKDIQVSLVAVVAQKMVAVGWESGGEGGEGRVGGDKLGPNGKVELFPPSSSFVSCPFVLHVK